MTQTTTTPELKQETTQETRDQRIERIGTELRSACEEFAAARRMIQEMDRELAEAQRNETREQKIERLTRELAEMRAEVEAAETTIREMSNEFMAAKRAPACCKVIGHHINDDGDRKTHYCALPDGHLPPCPSLS